MCNYLTAEILEMAIKIVNDPESFDNNPLSSEYLESYENKILHTFERIIRLADSEHLVYIVDGYNIPKIRDKIKNGSFRG